MIASAGSIGSTKQQVRDLLKLRGSNSSGTGNTNAKSKNTDGLGDPNLNFDDDDDEEDNPDTILENESDPFWELKM